MISESKQITFALLHCRSEKKKHSAFSLIEVVVAVGIFALGIVGVLGLLSPSIKSVNEVGDTNIAARLADNVQVELERLGFTAVTTALPGATDKIILVATRDGSRVLRADGTAPPADNNVASTTTAQGILNRDRYYGITVQQLPSLPYTAGNGFIALSVRVVWPYQIPSGPVDGATLPASEGASTWKKVLSTSDQSVMIFNMAIRP